MSITLSSLIEATKEDKELLQQLLSSFSCEKDSDIEYFLQSKAVEFERLGKARTYLLCDEEQLGDKNFCLDQLVIYGYVALALKVLYVPHDISNRQRKKLDGLSGKIHGNPIDSFSCYLIGQLARNSNVDPGALSGERLLQEAYDNIYTATEAVGGRYMLVECRDEEKLIQFYVSNGFEEFTRMSDGEHIQVQMIRKI